MNSEPDSREGLPSASKFERLVHCPGSRLAERFVQATIGAATAQDIALDGQEIHEALSKEDLSELGLTQEKLASRLQKMERDLIDGWIKATNSSARARIIREERFWIRHKQTLQPLTSARVDFARVTVDSSNCILMDFKTGFKIVTSAYRNWQLKVGLVALDQEYGPLKNARVAVAQHRLGDDVSISDFTRADIDHTYDEIVFYLQRSLDHNAPRVPGSWCDYCAAKTSCTEHAGYSMLPMVRGRVALANLDKSGIAAQVDVLPLEALAFVESRRTIAVNFFNAVKSRLKKTPADRLEKIGLKLVDGGSVRKIKDITKLWTILSREKICTEQEFREFCDVVIGRVEEKLITRIKLIRMIKTEEAEKILADLLAPVIELEPKEPLLKPSKEPE